MRLNVFRDVFRICAVVLGVLFVGVECDGIVWREGWIGS